MNTFYFEKKKLTMTQSRVRGVSKSRAVADLLFGELAFMLLSGETVTNIVCWLTRGKRIWSMLPVVELPTALSVSPAGER